MSVLLRKILRQLRRTRISAIKLIVLSYVFNTLKNVTLISAGRLNKNEEAAEFNYKRRHKYKHN